ncbi:MAG: glutamate cyclase domain-containing protein [Candidatus Bathyarchaeia archaeon]
MTEEDLLNGFGDVVDRLVTTPVGTFPVLRKGRDGPPKLRYTWMKVYNETRDLYGRPLCLLSAEELVKRVSPGDHVLILTNSHEMDGPPGAAALARALLVGLRAVPVIMANFKEGTKFERALTQSCTGAQIIPVRKRDELTGSIWTPYTTWIYNWPKMSVKKAREESKMIIDELDPKAVITVEATSCNVKGIRHGALGGPRNEGNPEEVIVRWNEILETAKDSGVLTIATGDNGNECGFATIEEILKRHHEYCRDCGCPCGSGIISAAGAEIVIPANSSNWAAYGIEACLAHILDKPEVMHNEYTHNRMLLNCANEGIPDGATAMATPTTDGASHDACIRVVGLLKETVSMASREIVREMR